MTYPMMLPTTLSEASISAGQIKANAQRINPGEWNDWITLIGALCTGGLWIWRHSVGGFFLWLWNFIKAPQLIKEQNALIKAQVLRIDQIEAKANFAVATSNVTWSFVERPILQFNALGQCMFANDFVLRLLVRQQDEFFGSGWQTLVHSDDVDRVERMWKTAVADKRNFALTFRLITRSGEEVKVFDRAEIMHDLHNNVLGWYHLMSVVED